MANGQAYTDFREALREYTIHIRCGDTGGLHSRQLMGKYAQTTCMYFPYSYVFSSSRDGHSADEQAYSDFREVLREYTLYI